MAGLSRSGGRFRIVWWVDGVQRSIRLSDVSESEAEVIRSHVSALIAGKAGSAVPVATLRWLKVVDDKTRRKLVKVGLIEEEAKPNGFTLADFVVEHVRRKAERVKPASLFAVKYALDSLIAFLGPDRLLKSVTEGIADDYICWLQSKVGLRPTTVRKRLEYARSLFRDAVKRRFIEWNPFESVKGPPVTANERLRYVPREVVLRLFDFCPNLEWKVLLAMSRFLGVRVPSEVLNATWSDVLWSEQKMVIRSPKTERYGKSSRIVPLVEPVHSLLEGLFQDAQEGESFIFPTLRCRGSMVHAKQGIWRAVNLRQGLLNILKRAGVDPWPRLYHNLRASCQTDLSEILPAHVVCQFLGNTVTVAERHYLAVHDEHYKAAVEKMASKMASNWVENNCF